MTRPTVTDTTETLYALLPEHYRTADEVQAAGALGYPLLRYLSLAGDQLDAVEILTDTVGAGLTDPATTPAAALGWLAQFVGEHLMPLMTDTEKRDAITAHESWSAGTVNAIVDAVKALLTGTKRVTLVEHWGGDGLVIAIWTYAGETPNPDAVVATVASHKPAGIGLASDVVQPGLTWYDAAHQYASWTAFAAAGAKTWAQRASEIPTY